MLATLFAYTVKYWAQFRSTLPQPLMEHMAIIRAMPLGSGFTGCIWEPRAPFRVGSLEMVHVHALVIAAREASQIRKVVILVVAILMVDMMTFWDRPDLFLPNIPMQEVAPPIAVVALFLAEGEPALAVAFDGVCAGICSHVAKISSYLILSIRPIPRPVRMG